MHRRLVARERHDGAAGLQTLENFEPFTAQGHGLKRLLMLPCMRRNDRSFGQAQGLCSLLGAKTHAASFRELQARGGRVHMNQ